MVALYRVRPHVFGVPSELCPCVVFERVAIEQHVRVFRSNLVSYNAVDGVFSQLDGEDGVGSLLSFQSDGNVRIVRRKIPLRVFWHRHDAHRVSGVRSKVCE